MRFSSGLITDVNYVVCPVLKNIYRWTTLYPGAEEVLMNSVTFRRCVTHACKQGNRDDADFREWMNILSAMRSVFCSYESLNVVAENSLAIAFRDAYPVTSLHTLVVPRRHIADYFGLYQPEQTQFINSSRKSGPRSLRKTLQLLDLMLGRIVELQQDRPSFIVMSRNPATSR